jgi:DNA polymerase/3'-5' exonuclease PolX
MRGRPVKIRAPLPVALRAADHLVSHLRRYTSLVSRVEIAGSVRRKKPEVGDIEIVAQTARQYRVEGMRSVLSQLQVQRGPPNKAGAAAPWGEKYFRGLFELAPGTDIGVDLFVVTPPAEWGVVYLIRTGSAEFSQAAVTRLHHWGLKSEQGRIIKPSTGATLPCPDESTFFRYARLPFLKPELRDTSLPEFEKAFGREWEPGEELVPA